MTPEQCRQRSRIALLHRFPGLEPVLAPDYGLIPIEEEGAVVDLATGDGRLLLGEQGRARTAARVADWLARPRRLVAPRPEPDLETESPLKTRLIASLAAACRQLGLDPAALPAAPVTGESFLVVLGIGLGHHLPALIEGAGCRQVILVETAPLLLTGSLAALDWQALLEQGEAEGRRFHLILEAEADAILQRLGRLFLGCGGAGVDGTGVFLHYPAPMLLEVQARINEIAQLAFMSRGYFEDELVMLANSRANLRRGGCGLIDAGRPPPRLEPVLVVGSGPSVDHSIDCVRRLRSQALVVSCGSALKVCLAHGIVPDFHCEIENGPWVPEALRTVIAGQDLTGVTLIAPTTVDPRVPALFERTLLFFREETAPTRLYALPGHEVFLAVPTVANTALRLMAGLGFVRFHLFGIDFGTKDTERRHSAATIYQELAEFRAYEEAMQLVHPCPGNFGGTVQADWVFTFSRLFLEKLIEDFGLEVVNCSDGARIAHARPLAPERLRLRGKAEAYRQHRAVLLAERAPPQPPWTLPPASGATLVRLGEALYAVLESAGDGDAGIAALPERMAEFFTTRREEFGGLTALFEGSALSWIKIGLWFLRRVADPGLRAALFRAFVAEYRRLVQQMLEEAAVRLAEAAS